LPQTKVLVVDDEVEFASVLAERLLLRNYDAKAVYTAEDALSLVQQWAPDVVLLDLQMPGMSGLEALKMIKQKDETIEVIILTGRGDESSHEQGLASGAFEYIMKPVDIGELLIRIDKAKKSRPKS
jgi:DNA-binding response OmpR family regulator